MSGPFGTEDQALAELSARRTAAAAVLADYLHGAGTADPDELSLCAARLADMLGHVLAVLDASDTAAVKFPDAPLLLARVRLVLDAFDWEAGDRQYALEQIDGIVPSGQLDADAEYDNDPEPYCTECGAKVAIFYAHGDGWHHYRGEGTAASRIELHDAGHAPVVGWRAVAGGDS